jgi:arsenite-transporting ATPase
MIKDLVLPDKKQVKFVFFSGKGGVGKSTMSCATAVWLAKAGYKTLLVTTDPAPNLADIFGQAIGHQITPILNVDNLHAIEINPDTASEEYRERIVAPLKELLDEKNLNVVREQLKSPCVEEVAAFDKFIEFMDDPGYDVVVFDTAPTGHTIRLLELPSGWTETLNQNAATCIGPGASLQSAKAKYEKAIGYLQDQKRTSFIFVLKPENSSLLETKRSTEELSRLGIAMSFLIVNGVLPAEACTDAFFRKKKVDEEGVIARIETEFPSLEKVFYPLRDAEVSGITLLYNVGNFIYEGKQDLSRSESPVTTTNAQVNLAVYRNEHCLDLLKPSNGQRYVFFTGKGGVGKSTIASTTALYLADHGYKDAHRNHRPGVPSPRHLRSGDQP